MSQFDLSLDELQRYRGDPHPPAGLDAFWSRTLDEARVHPVALETAAIDAGLPLVDVADASFAGFGGQRIRAWLLLPRGIGRPLPGIVRYVGYGGGRGEPYDHLAWPAAGFATLVMDTRGQGSAWSAGATPDIADEAGSGPQHPGFLTRGIATAEGYYYRRLFTDAVRAVDALRAHAAVDPARVAVGGASQGGAMALAVASLVPDLRGALIDVPFLADIRRAIRITDALPYAELAQYLAIHRGQVDAALATIDHVDVVHLGPWASAPALFSVGLMDHVTPPSTVFAAYHAYGGPKQLRVLPYSGHDAGGVDHVGQQLGFLRGLGLGGDASASCGSRRAADPTLPRPVVDALGGPPYTQSLGNRSEFPGGL